MPARSDKLDAMVLAASVSGFDFDVLEGVAGESIPKKALSGVSGLIHSILYARRLTMAQEMGK